jgi:hypothetical protein
LHSRDACRAWNESFVENRGIAMCRNIRRLRQPDRPPTEDELYDAALQFVRKVSGYRKPSRVNQAAFDKAVAEIAASTRTLLGDLVAR